MTERDFTTIGKTCVDCSRCCWNEKLGLVRSEKHFVQYLKNHLALNININERDFGMLIAVCGDPGAPLQQDGKPRL